MKSYRANLKENDQGLTEEEISGGLAMADQIEANYQKKTWAEYRAVEKRNELKKAAMKKLNKVTCLIAKRNWNKECDSLLDFYENENLDLQMMH